MGWIAQVTWLSIAGKGEFKIALLQIDEDEMPPDYIVHHNGIKIKLGGKVIIHKKKWQAKRWIKKYIASKPDISKWKEVDV